MQNRLLLIIIIISLILGASTLTRGHEWGDDFASYIMQAESIWNGTTRDFVQHNSFTIFESSKQIGPVAYPWGYPLILTPVVALKGISPLALKIPSLLFYAGFLICLFFLMKKQLSQTESLLLVCLFAFNPLLLKFLDQILSDIPFLFFSTLALLIITDVDKPNTRQLVFIGIILFVCYFIRTTGILLLATFILAEFWEIYKKRNDRVIWQSRLKNITIVCLVVGVLFLVNILLFPAGELSHLMRYQEFQEQTALQFANSYFSVFGLFFGETSFWQIVYYISLVFFLTGVWIQRKKDFLFIIFFVLSVIVLITWPSWQGPRFIFPLLTIFAYFIFQGMKFLLGKLPQKYTATGLWAFYGLWSLIIVVFLFNSIVSAYSNLKNDRAINGPFDSYSKEVYKYIEEKTPANSIIIFFKPRAMRLMTDHDSFMSTECDRMLKGDYLVLSKKVGENQQIPPEKIGACNLPLTSVLSNSRFIVYQIQK